MIHQSSISVKVGETDAKVTNFAGVVAFANLAQELGLFDELDRWLPAKERDRGLSNGAAVFDLMSIVLSGGERIEDLDRLRQDKGLERLLGREVMASRTAHDFLRRICYDGLEGLERARRTMIGEMARRRAVKTATLDCDASLFASSGRNARMSYKGERGYMPMLAFWEELGVVVHDDFRNGNASPQSDALAFLCATLAQLPSDIESVQIRSDSAWYQAGLLDYCDEHGHRFCIGADQDEAVKKALMAVMGQDAWQPINLPTAPSQPQPHVCEWACETVHTLNDSKRSYRLIFIRKERLDPDLFEGPYTYRAIVTNMDLSLEEQIAWYRKRGQCEQQIGELKWDFELRVLPSGDFFVNAVYLRIMTLAYNLFVALKTLTLSGDLKKARLKTVLFRLLKVPALVVKRARRIWLKLPRGHPAVSFFQAITNGA